MKRFIAISLILAGLIMGQVNHIGTGGEGGLQKENEGRQEKENLDQRFQDNLDIINLQKMLEDWKRLVETFKWEGEMMDACLDVEKLPNHLAIICRDFLDSFKEEKEEKK
ncbi:MAG: hypothetical protein G01um101433_1052 [Parcubacteria group bacterium Gr01-1014_33]|nr:MAG: hypothetical protein G01um101433_1052 [Parcubacteria group bacterium Gr01-1014_33]